jgi:glucokinase
MSGTPLSIIGIDLGGTKIAAGLFDAVTLECRRKVLVPTGAARGFRFVQEDLLKIIDDLRETGTAGIGIGVPGFVDAVTQKVLRMPNIPGAEGSDVRTAIAAYTKLPVAIDNDARCFAFAEAVLGAGKGHRTVVGVTLGTGVGGGIVVDGKIFHGAHGFAGEFGHMLLVPSRPPLETDDRRGEVEQFISGSALGRRCPDAKTPQEYLEGERCALLHPAVIREVAWFVTNLTYAVDPSIVVLGGSVGKALKAHLPAVRIELARWALPGIPPPEIGCGILEGASLLGAVLIAKDSR